MLPIRVSRVRKTKRPHGKEVRTMMNNVTWHNKLKSAHGMLPEGFGWLSNIGRCHAFLSKYLWQEYLKTTTYSLHMVARIKVNPRVACDTPRKRRSKLMYNVITRQNNACEKNQQTWR